MRRKNKCLNHSKMYLVTTFAEGEQNSISHDLVPALVPPWNWISGQISRWVINTAGIDTWQSNSRLFNYSIHIITL